MRTVLAMKPTEIAPKRAYTVDIEKMDPGFVIPFITWLRVSTGGCNVWGEWKAALHLAGCELTREQAYMIARMLDDGWIKGQLLDDETGQPVVHSEDDREQDTA